MWLLSFCQPQALKRIVFILLNVFRYTYAINSWKSCKWFNQMCNLLQSRRIRNQKKKTVTKIRTQTCKDTFPYLNWVLRLSLYSAANFNIIYFIQRRNKIDISITFRYFFLHFLLSIFKNFNLFCVRPPYFLYQLISCFFYWLTKHYLNF